MACPQAALSVSIAGGGILAARRRDIMGAMLYLTLLSLLGFGAWVVLTVISMSLTWFGEKTIYLFVCLIIIKEFQRFMDNEYGEGIGMRRATFAAIGILVATIQILLIWKA